MTFHINTCNLIAQYRTLQQYEPSSYEEYECVLILGSNLYFISELL